MSSKGKELTIKGRSAYFYRITFSKGVASMKKILLLILTLLTRSVIAQSHEHRPANKNIFLFAVMSKRCERYLIVERNSCEDAVNAMLKALDYDYIVLDKTEESPKWLPKSFVFTVFKKDLIQSLSEHRTTLFLKDIETSINLYLSERREFNLWTLSLQHYQSPLEASRALATLFQDTSPRKLHLGFLEHSRARGRMNFQSNKVQLARVIDLINQLYDFDSEASHVLYPPFVKEDLNRNIYHYYVPFFIAQKLRYRELPQRQTFLGPLMMTLSYEFITTTRNLDFVFTDPQTITNFGTQKDIMAGYLGAFFGSFRQNPISFPELQVLLQRSTQEGVSLLIKP